MGGHFRGREAFRQRMQNRGNVYHISEVALRPRRIENQAQTAAALLESFLLTTWSLLRDWRSASSVPAIPSAPSFNLSSCRSDNIFSSSSSSLLFSSLHYATSIRYSLFLHHHLLLVFQLVSEHCHCFFHYQHPLITCFFVDFSSLHFVCSPPKQFNLTPLLLQSHRSSVEILIHPHIEMPNLATLLPMYTPTDPNPPPKPTASTPASSLSPPFELRNHHINNSATPAAPISNGFNNTNEQARVDSPVAGLDTIDTEDSQRHIHPALRKPAPVLHRVPTPRQAIAGMDGAEDVNTMSGALPDE